MHHLSHLCHTNELWNSTHSTLLTYALWHVAPYATTQQSSLHPNSSILPWSATKWTTCSPSSSWQMSPHALMPCTPTSFETTDWLGPLWNHSSSHSGSNTLSGKCSCEDSFLNYPGSDRPCQATSLGTAIRDLHKFWYLRHIHLSVRIVSSPCLGSDAHGVAFLILYGLWHLPHTWMPSLPCVGSDSLIGWPRPAPLTQQPCSAPPNSFGSKMFKKKRAMEGKGKWKKSFALC